ncbi:MAG: hypothetical protein LBU80_04910 [Rikenellaceae bacterium]|jgi:Ser-tRNA(Ala) deacylase AlaX|nr:hypothetical protein [Rikenellaceae bacterium]
MEINGSKKDYCEPMHTAEHLLSGTIARIYGCGRPFSTHIEKRKSKVDFHLDHQPSREELDRIEFEVNALLQEGLDVTEEFLPRDEAVTRYNLERLPEEAGATVRIVRTGDADACPCVGAHVANTAEIPPIRIVSADCNDGVLRVRFKFQ